MKVKEKREGRIIYNFRNQYWETEKQYKERK